MLPAGERAHAAHGGVDHRETRAVALAPDHPLMEGRRDLPPLQFQRAVGVEHELRIIERSVVALVDSEDDDRAVLARRRRDPIRLRTWRRNGVLIETDVLCAALDGRRDKGEVRVPRDEGLGEDDELGALPRRFVDRGDHALERRRARRQIGRDLNRRGAHFLLLCHRVLVCSGGPKRARRWSRQSVQVSRMKALSRRWSSTRSSTSRGLIGRIPSINDGSPWP